MKESRRYLVFGYPDYYPNGGSTDLMLMTNSLQEAVDCIENDLDPGYSGRVYGNDNYEILDAVEGKFCFFYSFSLPIIKESIKWKVLQNTVYGERK